MGVLAHVSELWPPWASAGALAFWGLSCNAVVYGMLNKKWLPKALWRPLSRAYFWPMLPVAVARRNLPWSPPYWAEVTPGVYLGAVPIVMLGHVEELYKLGVRAVVNMQDEYGGPVSEYARLGIAQAHFPTVDHVEPSLAALESAVEFIKAHRAKGHKVYVHCKGGHGRGAAVAFAWMLHADGLGLQETQNRLSSIRNVRAKLWRQPNIVRFHAQLRENDA
eukprot:g2117.t1